MKEGKIKIRIIALIIAVFIMSADVITFADVLVEELGSNEEILEEVIDEEKINNDSSIGEDIQEEVIEESSDEESSKENEIESKEKVQVKDGEYLVRNILVGSKKVIEEYSEKLDEDNLIQAKTYDDYILVSKSILEVEEDSDVVEFNYIKKISKDSPIKQYVVRHVVEDEGKLVDIYEPSIRINLVGEEANESALDLPDYKAIDNDVERIVNENLDEIIIKYEKRNAMVSLFNSLLSSKSNTTEVYLEFKDKNNTNIFSNLDDATLKELEDGGFIVKSDNEYFIGQGQISSENKQSLIINKELLYKLYISELIIGDNKITILDSLKNIGNRTDYKDNIIEQYIHWDDPLFVIDSDTVENDSEIIVNKVMKKTHIPNGHAPYKIEHIRTINDMSYEIVGNNYFIEKIGSKITAKELTSKVKEPVSKLEYTIENMEIEEQTENLSEKEIKINPMGEGNDINRVSFYYGESGYVEKVNSSLNPDNSVQKNHEYSIYLRDVMTNKEIEKGIKEEIVDHYYSKEGTRIDRQGPEIDGYILLKEERQNIVLSEDDNVLKYNYIKKDGEPTDPEEPEVPEGEELAHFIVEHYKGEPKNAEFLETTTGSGLVGDLLWAKDQEINYEGLELVSMDPEYIKLVKSTEDNIIKLYYKSSGQTPEEPEPENPGEHGNEQFKYTVKHVLENGESIKNFKEYDYSAKSARNTMVSIYGREIEGYTLISKTPVEERITKDGQVIEIKYIEEEDTELGKNQKVRYIEKHKVRKTRKDNKGEDITYYEDILKPRVFEANVGTKVKMEHKAIVGYRPLVEDDKQILEINMNEAGKTYEIIAIYEETDNPGESGENPETPEEIEEDRDTEKEEESKEKSKYTIEHRDYQIKDKEEAVIQKDEYMDYVGKEISISHLSLEGYVPYITDETIDELTISKKSNKNKFVLYYRKVENTATINIEYIDKINNKEIGKYTDNIEASGYVGYNKYLEMFRNGNIISNPEDYKFDSASPQIIKLLADGKYEMTLYFTSDKGTDPGNPGEPESKTGVVNVLYKKDNGDIVGRRQERRQLNSWHYITEDLDNHINIKEKLENFELISRPVIKVQFTDKVQEVEFIYKKKSEEVNLERYYMRFVEELDTVNGKEYVDILDPITGLAKVGDIVRVPNLEDGMKTIKGINGEKLYEFQKYLPETKIINMTKDGKNTAYYVYKKAEDNGEELPEELPEEDKDKDKNKETKLEVRYVERNNKSNLIGGYTLNANKNVEIELHAENRIKVRDSDYLLVTRSPQIFRDDAVGSDEAGYIITFEYVNEANVIPDETEEISKGYYLVKHVRDLGNGKIRNIVTPGFYDGMPGSKIGVSRLSEDLLKELFAGKYKYTGKVAVNGEEKNEQSTSITLDKKEVQEVVFYYDFTKDTEGNYPDNPKDPEMIDKDSNDEIKDKEYGVLETSISSENNWSSNSDNGNMSDNIFKTPFDASVTVYRDNNYDTNGNIIDKDEKDIRTKHHTLYSPSRQNVDFKNEIRSNLPKVEFVYINSKLNGLDSRISVRYVEVDNEDEVDRHIQELKKDNDGTYGMTLKDIKSRTIFKSNFVNGLAINKIEKTTEPENTVYEYAGDTGSNEKDKADVVTGEYNKHRVDYFIFMKKSDSKSSTDYLKAMKKDHRYVVEYNLDNDEVIQRIHGSESSSSKHKALDFTDRGYKLADGENKEFNIDGLVKGVQSKTPVVSFNYVKTDGEPEEPEIPEEPEEPKEPEKPGGGGGGGGGGQPVEPEKPEKPQTGGRPHRPDKDKDQDKEIIEMDKLTSERDIRYIEGYKDNTVRPDANIRREEVAAIIYRILNDDYRESIKTDEHNFEDIREIWSEHHIATLTDVGVLEGFPDGTFRPKDTMTRAELTAVMARLNELELTYETQFKDVGDHWAKGYINAVKTEGWIEGYSDNTFRPSRPIKRSELITMVNNMLDKEEDNGKPVKDFKDLESFRWYYGDINSAVIY